MKVNGLRTLLLGIGILVFTNTSLGQVPRIIKNINPLNAANGLSDWEWGAYMNPYAEINGIIYFGANDGVHGNEMWRTDGTEAGTYMVKDISPGSEHTYLEGYVKVGNLLLFMVSGYMGDNSNSNFWRTDGTESGTFQISFFSGSNETGERLMSQELSKMDKGHAVLGNSLYFTTYDNSMKRFRIRKTDGLNAGSTIYYELVKNNSLPGLRNGEIRNIKSYRDKLFIECDTASDYMHNPYGNELYWSDGISAPTLYCDLTSGTGSSRLEDFVNVNNSFLVFITANNLLYSIKDFTGCPEFLTVAHIGWAGFYYEKIVNNRLFFPNRSMDVNEAEKEWSTDGTAAGTFISDIEYPFYIGKFKEFALYSVGDKIKKWNGITPTTDWLLDSVAPSYGGDGKYYGAIESGNNLILTRSYFYSHQLILTDGTNSNFYRLTPEQTPTFSFTFRTNQFQLFITAGAKLFMDYYTFERLNFTYPETKSGRELATVDLSTIIWTGKVSDDWNDPANWWPNKIPTLTDPVLITLSPRYPAINTGIIYAKELTVNYGNLTIGPLAQLILGVH